MLHPQVEIFFQVVESGSFSRAAGARSCSPVSIMNQINALEDRLGIRLLARTSRGVSLTEAGALFYRDAKELGEAAGRAINRARMASASGLPVVRLGTSFLRPCKPLLERLEHMRAAWREVFRINIVAFDDEPKAFSRLLQSLGTEIDCFVSPCDSAAWMQELTVFHLGMCRCCVSLPASHRLAGKASLAWEDLYGERLMLVARGISPTLDRLRADIVRNHPAVTILDAPGYYDVEVFNRCEQEGCLMETPEIWAGVHPALVTLPVEWDYALPYGIVAAKEPSAALELLLGALRAQ